MEKSLSAIGNYIDNITSTTGRNVLDWFTSANPIVVLILLIALIAFFFTPMLRYYLHRIYWKLAAWRAWAMSRRYGKLNTRMKIGDAVTDAIENLVYQDLITRGAAQEFYRDLGTITGIVDLIPRKKPRRLDILAQAWLKSKIKDRIPDVDKKLAAMRENSNGIPPKVPTRRRITVHV